jgi:hypothetical protein
VIRFFWFAISLLLMTSSAWSQQVPDVFMQEPVSMGEGWKGFTDFSFLANALATLVLAAVLGAVIAFHPKHIQTADTLQEIEAPKVFITYSVIGALIGIMVVKYGLVVGFVLFGIGGLIRFRTVLYSPTLTGGVIFVTLIGLSCGLDLPHVAVLATVFGYVLIFVLNRRITYRINIGALPPERIVEAAAAYRTVLEQQGCRIKSEKKNPAKAKITFIFRAAGKDSVADLESALESQVDASLKGYLDWEIE